MQSQRDLSLKKSNKIAHNIHKHVAKSSVRDPPATMAKHEVDLRMPIYSDSDSGLEQGAGDGRCDIGGTFSSSSTTAAVPQSVLDWPTAPVLASLFLDKNTIASTFDGVSDARNLFTSRPQEENTRSEGTDVAVMQSLRFATCESIGKRVELHFHYSSGCTSIPSGRSAKYVLTSGPEESAA